MESRLLQKFGRDARIKSILDFLALLDLRNGIAFALEDNSSGLSSGHFWCSYRYSKVHSERDIRIRKYYGLALLDIV